MTGEPRTRSFLIHD